MKGSKEEHEWARRTDVPVVIVVDVVHGDDDTHVIRLAGGSIMASTSPKLAGSTRGFFSARTELCSSIQLPQKIPDGIPARSRMVRILLKHLPKS